MIQPVPLAETGSVLSSFALRYDRGLGAAVAFRALDLRELYIVPRLTLNLETRDIGVEAVVTRSAAQFLSSYTSAGIARERVPDGDGDDETAKWRMTVELGIKIRVPVSGRWRIATLGYHFGGIRLGIRASGVDDLDPIRLVFELGAGVW